MVSPQSGPPSLQDRFVILACDGFWNAWTAAEALEFTLSLVANEEGRAESLSPKKGGIVVVPQFGNHRKTLGKCGFNMI